MQDALIKDLEIKTGAEGIYSVTGYLRSSDHLFRALHPTPIASYESHIQWSGLTAMKRPAVDWNNWTSIGMHKNWKAKLRKEPGYELFFNYIFPLERFFALMSIYTIQGVSSMRGIDSAFSTTKEEILKLFRLCHNTGDYTYVDENVACMGFNAGIESEVSKHVGSIFANCLPDFSMGGGVDICAPGIGFPGIGMAFPIKFAIKTPLLILKGLIELLDPLISIAKLLQMALKVAGICLPVPALAWAMLPINIFIPPPFGIGIGPPLTPLGMVYMALGFGSLDLSLDLGGEFSLNEDLKLSLLDAGVALSPVDLPCGAVEVGEDDVQAGGIAARIKEISKKPMSAAPNEMVMARLIQNVKNEEPSKESLNDFVD